MKLFRWRKVIHDALFIVLKYVAQLRMPRVAALMLRIMTVAVTRGARGARTGTHNILMLPKEAFVEDVHASLAESDRFRIYCVWRMAFKALSLGFLPRTVNDNFYVSDDPAMVRGKEQYRAFLARMWNTYGSLLRIDGVVTANFGYYAERELASMLEARGIPFVVMHKENLKSPGLGTFYIDLYRDRRGPFTGRRVLVYNEIERSLQLEAGVVSPSQVVVCGMPRLDRIHAWRRRHAGTTPPSREKLVLFFAFTDKTGLPMISRKPRSGFEQGREILSEELENLTWGRLFEETNRSIVQFAVEHPGVKVVIKTKRPELFWDPVAGALGGSTELPGNVRLVRGGDPMDLITSADVVVGFNTTALLESLAAGKPVVVPGFAEAQDPQMRPYIVELGQAVERASSPRDLRARLSRHLDARAAVPRELRPECVQVLEYWCGNADGAAGERICQAVEAEFAPVDERGRRGASSAHA